ncbi:uncharacterized protein G2W53_026969 [Senna tora]|uniref:Uncharacterized protein n=1 Tax=Senna tora TaxID=362788 RepID=A0A834TI52_9FABA|nr:uncharacterized protein G2W53_026969 [Senna tora]
MSSHRRQAKIVFGSYHHLHRRVSFALPSPVSRTTVVVPPSPLWCSFSYCAFISSSFNL